MNITQAKFLVIDLETTGVDHTVDKVVEFAAKHLDVPHLSYNRLINPGIPIPPSASAIHHITDEMVLKSSPFMFDVFCKKITEKIAPFNVLVGHNIKGFDNKFLPEHQYHVLDTMLIAKKLWPDLESYSNQFIRYYFKLYHLDKVGRSAHDALGDVNVTMEILKLQLNLIKKTGLVDLDDENGIENLITLSETPNLVKVCKFNKYRDKNWSDVPRDYIQWVLGNVKDLNDDLIFTCKYYLGIKQ